MPDLLYVVTAASDVRQATFGVPAGADPEPLLAREFRVRAQSDRLRGVSADAAAWLICEVHRVEWPLTAAQETALAERGWVLLHEVDCREQVATRGLL